MEIGRADYLYWLMPNTLAA